MSAYSEVASNCKFKTVKCAKLENPQNLNPTKIKAHMICVLPSPLQLCAVQFVQMGPALLTTPATVLDSVGAHATCQVAAQTHSMGCGAECIVRCVRDM